ncbi:MAG: Rieske 2Fe-2S domain-containing protein [Acidimicrobiales bacterium]
MIRNCWYCVSYSDELEPGVVHARIVTGQPIVLWRSAGGQVSALDARCAHKQFPLWEGRLLRSGALECAYHGFAYDTDGHCVAVPALAGRSARIPEGACVRKFPAVEQDGMVWLWPGEGPGEGPGATGPPRTPEVASPEWETLHTEAMEVAADARLLIENLLDLTHFYPLHAGNIGTYEDASVPVEIERDRGEGGFMLLSTRTRTGFTFGPTKADWFGISTGDNVASHEMVSPGLFHVVERGAPPGRLGTAEERSFVLYQTITPLDEGRLVWRRSVSCRAGSHLASDPSKPLVQAVMSGCSDVVAEDRWALEQQQRMMAVPAGRFREVHIRTDAAVVMARRMLDQMERAEQDAVAEGQPLSGNGSCGTPTPAASQDVTAAGGQAR